MEGEEGDPPSALHEKNEKRKSKKNLFHQSLLSLLVTPFPNTSLLLLQ